MPPIGNALMGTGKMDGGRPTSITTEWYRDQRGEDAYFYRCVFADGRVEERATVPNDWHEDKRPTPEAFIATLLNPAVHRGTPASFRRKCLSQARFYRQMATDSTGELRAINIACARACLDTARSA